MTTLNNVTAKDFADAIRKGLDSIMEKNPGCVPVVFITPGDCALGLTLMKCDPFQLKSFKEDTFRYIMKTIMFVKDGYTYTVAGINKGNYFWDKQEWSSFIRARVNNPQTILSKILVNTDASSALFDNLFTQALGEEHVNVEEKSPLASQPTLSKLVAGFSGNPDSSIAFIPVFNSLSKHTTVANKRSSLGIQPIVVPKKHAEELRKLNVGYITPDLNRVDTSELVIISVNKLTSDSNELANSVFTETHTLLAVGDLSSAKEFNLLDFDRAVDNYLQKKSSSTTMTNVYQNIFLTGTGFVKQ